MLALHVLHPLVGLPLRVDHERPALAARDKDAVVHAHVVRGQPPDVPLAHLHRARQRCAQAGVVAHGHCRPAAPRHPVVHQPDAVAAGEGAVVGDAGGRDEDVAHQQLHRLPQRVRRLLPPHPLVRQRARQLARALQPLLRDVRLVVEVLLLPLRGRQLLLQLLHAGDHRRQRALLLLQRLVGLPQGGLRLAQLGALGLHHLGHIVVHVHRARPHAQALGGVGLLGHDLGGELRVIRVLLELADHSIRDVVLVKLH
mmetsp:Transcript_31624/g.81841  ORF Transcript_31624/g.81841 Transcript_31624/m.81841 type:complete len:256 (+) Transcript_31624:902-1669(+)